MEVAFAKNRLPYLRKLTLGGYYRRMSFYSGLPSATPAVQAEVMYGVKTAVPAFQFLHRKSGKVFAMFDQAAACTIAEEILRDGEPLLKDGASFSNIYSGGSPDARGCIETRSLSALWAKIRPLKLFLTLCFYSFTLLRVAALGALELLIALGDMISGILRRDWRNEVKFVPIRVLVSIVLREWVRVVVKLSLDVGTPVIYANLLAYDEQSHRRGPSSKLAHWGLLGIDGVIKDIFNAAQRADGRNYEVIVFSDHGQEAVRIYDFEYGKTIHEAVTEALQSGPLANRMVTSIDDAVKRGGRVDHWMQPIWKRRGSKPRRPSLTPDELVNNVIVTALGPLGHVYFPVPVTDEAKAECAARLVQREHVPLVLYQLQNGDVLGRNARGLWNVNEDCSAICGTNHRFENEIQADLIGLCKNPNSGDLIISGWDPDLPPLTFVQENGSHGGPGYRETRGFVLLPYNVDSQVREAKNGEAYLRGVDLHEAALNFLYPDRSPETRPSQTIVRTSADARTSPDARTSTTLASAKSAGATSTSDARLRVMTYNAHSCIGMDGRCQPLRIAQVIADCGADVIALQEMDDNRERSRFQNQTEVIASRLGMYYRFFPVLSFSSERYGLSILSRFPISVVREAVFSDIVPRAQFEARGAMWVTIETSAGPVNVVNTHLGLNAKERQQQIDQLLSAPWLANADPKTPLIVCGDLNAGPKSEVMRRLQKQFYCVQQMAQGHRPEGTFASMLPLRRIDHILVSRHFAVNSVSVPKNYTTRIASDHLPVCAELTVYAPSRQSTNDNHSSSTRSAAVSEVCDTSVTSVN
jgi:endonuclease/exonuclease/phosphatase family metal-dependent hydrolase